MAKRTGLGKGLEALFEDNEQKINEREYIKISKIEPNTNQPRRMFDEQSLTSLADSIRQHGVIQPLLIKPIEEGNYQIIAGERRFRAARMIGLEDLPVIILNVTDKQADEIALIENLQREDLNPIEEANGYFKLMQDYNLTQEEVAKRVGKSRSKIANTLRLLNLPEPIVDFLKKGKLSEGQARTILGFKDEKAMIDIAKETHDKGLSVHQLERILKKANSPKKQQQPQLIKRETDNFYKEMEISLSTELGRKISIDMLTNQHGTLTIHFYNKEELTDISYKLADLRRD